MLPKFNNYTEEGRVDAGYETLQDFFLSWTLRCAADIYRNVNSKLHEYARRMVYFLIKGKNEGGKYLLEEPIPADFKIIDLKTRRQKGHIDLIAEIDLEMDGDQTSYILSIENKWYTTLSQGQLQNYRKFIEQTYPEHEHVHLFITCDGCRKYYESEKEHCTQNGYKFLTIPDMAYYAGIYEEGSATGNALFDEYWQN